jgi:hypothetical protein
MCESSYPTRLLLETRVEALGRSEDAPALAVNKNELVAVRIAFVGMCRCGGGDDDENTGSEIPRFCPE